MTIRVAGNYIIHKACVAIAVRMQQMVQTDSYDGAALESGGMRSKRNQRGQKRMGVVKHCFLSTNAVHLVTSIKLQIGEHTNGKSS